MKHTKRMTYKPKLEEIKAGRVTQTIRKGRNISIGDTIYFIDIDLEVTVSLTIPIFCFEDFVWFGYYNTEGEFILEWWVKWTDPLIDQLAKDDGIDPPTGLELKRVLLELYKMEAFPRDGFEMQIIVW
ncbi:MAG: hypothetical protein SVK08_01135 [Halobacteriota archaeon]|nr:hypothetical protein [Halobacteriota archaeon]